MSLTRRWGKVKAQLDAKHAPAAVPCADAVELWQRIYHTEPDEWQRDILRSQSPRVLINAARQSGKSTVAAVLGLYEALYHAPSLVLLLSASLRQAQELGKVLFDGYRRLGKPVSAEAENRLSLELSNGSRVVCLPSREQTVRGYSSVRLIVADEAARIPDPLYHSLRPMLAVSGGALIALSTPNGKIGWFYESWQNSDEFYRVRITADQCPRISPVFLAEEKRTLPRLVYAQEYDCQFVETTLNPFHQEDIAAAIRADILPMFPGRRFAE
jgi:hypothetical protein